MAKFVSMFECGTLNVSLESYLHTFDAKRRSKLESDIAKKDYVCIQYVSNNVLFVVYNICIMCRMNIT